MTTKRTIKAQVKTALSKRQEYYTANRANILTTIKEKSDVTQKDIRSPMFTFKAIENRGTAYTDDDRKTIKTLSEKGFSHAYICATIKRPLCATLNESKAKRELTPKEVDVQTKVVEKYTQACVKAIKENKMLVTKSEK